MANQRKYVKKGGHGGRRPGAGLPKGRKLPAITIERIRASINSKLCVDTLHELAKDGGQHDGVRATAALGLLRKVLPDLSATDITSAGEPLTVEHRFFNARAMEQANGREKAGKVNGHARPGQAQAQGVDITNEGEAEG